MTAHRRENWSGGLERIAEAVGGLAPAHPAARFVVPLHPNPLVRRELGEPLAAAQRRPHRAAGLRGVRATDGPLGARADRLGRDPGGAPALGSPCWSRGASTERGEGVTAGTLTLVGTDPSRSSRRPRGARRPAAYASMPADNPYGDGRAPSASSARWSTWRASRRRPRASARVPRRGVLEAAATRRHVLDARRRARRPRPQRGARRWVAGRTSP